MSTAHSPLNGTAPHLVGGVAAGWNSLSAVGPVRVTGASGPYIRDDQGRELLDFIMGWGSCFLGHDAPPIREALQRRSPADSCTSTRQRPTACWRRSSARSSPVRTSCGSPTPASKRPCTPCGSPAPSPAGAWW
ncbi:hypothetical protein ACFQ60_02175 [Streptomyces zhihengii]